MNKNLYGGINYPASSFVFDKVYSNYTEAMEKISNDEILIGRYILVAYCDTAFTQDERNKIIATDKEQKYMGEELTDEQKFWNNFFDDGKICNDRKVYRKIYKNNTYSYEEIAQLNSGLSDNSITVRGVAAQEGRILSLSALIDDNSDGAIDGGGLLSTTLKIQIANHDNSTWIQLIGVNDCVISEIDADDFIADGVLGNVEFKQDTNELLFTWNVWDAINDEYITKTKSIKLDDILQPYIAGNGIAISNVMGAKDAKINIQIDPNSEKFLSVGASGLKLSGIQNALNAVKNQVKQANSYADLGGGTNIGDIGIVTTPIATGKTSYTAYVWNGTAWQAMDGNYNADNIYFDEDIMITKEIGYITLTNGNGTIPSKGKNLVEVFDTMFTKELNPSKTEPSVNISLNKAGSYEVGTTVTGISCTVSFNDGTYSYGPEPTGAKVNSWEIKDSNNKTYSYSASAISIPNVLVTDGINYTITAKASHSIGDIPKTNKGNNCTDTTKRIAAGTKSKTSAAITGYRYAFAGGTNASALSSSIIRGMSAKKSSKDDMNTKGKALEFSAAKGTTKVFFAYPTSWTGTPYFEMFGLAWAENVNFVKKENIQVADARGGSNGLSSYKLYMWELNPGLEAENTNFRVWFK